MSQKGISLNSPNLAGEDQLRVMAACGGPDPKGPTLWEGASLDMAVGAGQEQPLPFHDTPLWGPECSPDKTQAKGDHVRDSAPLGHPHFCLGSGIRSGVGRVAATQASRMPDSVMAVLWEAPRWPRALN